MTRRFWLSALGLSYSLPLLAKGNSQGNARSKGKPRPQQDSGLSVGIVFSSADRSAIWDYYDRNPQLLSPAVRRLPPGLVKKLQRGKPLPPGWQKKIMAFPDPLAGRMPPLPGGYRRVIVDRWALIIAVATNAIVDIVDLIRR